MNYAALKKWCGENFFKFFYDFSKINPNFGKYIYEGFFYSSYIIKIDRNAPHVIIEAKKEYPALQRIKLICDDNSLNLKNIDITEFDKDKLIVKAYFPYRVNPLLLEYFINELLKEDGIINASKVMKEEKKKFEDTHES